MDIREMQVNTIKGLKTVYDTYSIGRIVNAAKKPNVGDHFITKDDLLKANGKIDQISKPIEQVTKIFNLSTDSYIYKSFATQ
ncbi:hypothetical protein FACS1894166_12310 [Bacilli bacterium]|nr:hypothetical protein FACS1894166_12310 [Bacilli bacterium]